MRTLKLAGSSGRTISSGEDWSDYKDIRMDLTFPEPKAVSVDPRKTLLQIVDMQTAFVGSEAKKNFWQADKYIAQIRKLLELARELDMVVVHQYSMSIPNPYRKTRKRLKADPPAGPIIDELKPVDRPREHIVSKTGHDIFFHTHG